MQEIDYFEDQARRNAAFSLETLALLQQRAQGFLTLLLGGAGGSAVYALGQLGKPGGQWAVWALGALSVWWFALAAWVAVRAVPTREVRAPANSGWVLLGHMRGPLRDYVEKAADTGQASPDAFALLREAELKVVHETAAIYRAASSGIAAELDRVYRCAAASPLWVALALLGARFLGAI